MVKDILNKELKIGSSIVCQGYDGLLLGTVKEFTSETVVIEIHSPYEGRKLIRHDLINIKVMITDGCS